jgi:large subunit ribosomal protein L5
MNLHDHYKNEIIPLLMKEMGVVNVMAVPRVTRVVVNMGIKEAAHDKGLLEKAAEQMAEITGQKAKVTRAKKSIANFKLREGDPVGLAATLRGKRMYDFMTKLFTIVLPRVRDFHGLPTTAFDHRGNYTLGMTEQISFVEIDYAKIDKIRGLEITFVISGGDAKISRRLLELLGMPFVKS